MVFVSPFGAYECWDAGSFEEQNHHLEVEDSRQGAGAGTLAFDSLESR